MKKVLFPFEIDHACFREAYVYAVKMARNIGAELIMLYAFQIEADDTITTTKYNILIKNNWLKAYREILRFHDYYLNDHARVDTELRVKTDHRIVHGNLVEEFMKILHSENIDLVVLPAAGDTEPARRRLKLLLREALDTNNSDVLSIPCKRSFLPIENMLLITGLKQLKGLTDYLDEICVYANIFNSSIHYVHFSKHEKESLDIDEEMRQLKYKARSRGKNLVFRCIKDRAPGGRLLEYISQNNIRLLAVAKQQIHSIETIYKTGLFDEMCSQVGIPVLILKGSRLS